MNDWTPIEHLLDKALYQQLTASEQTQFDAHLRAHPSLAQEFEQLRQTLDIMEQRSLAEPNEAYWNHLTSSVVQRSTKTDIRPDKSQAPGATGSTPEITVHPIGLAAKLQQKLAKSLDISHSWTYKLTAAAALLLVGFFAGRASENSNTYSANSGAPSYGFALDRHSLPIAELSEDMLLQDRVRAYLERSSFLLMLNGSPQIDHEALLSCGFDLDHQQQMSRELLVQTRDLKSELSVAESPHGRAIGDLVADIEGYLVSISNLDDPGDIHTLRPLHRQMDEIFCQVKCNLDELSQ